MGGRDPVADLLLVADGAYPQPDYSFLSAHIPVWAGYLGGHTPHDWTLAEITALRDTGRRWWGIWTAPDKQAINAGQGVTDAGDTIDRLVALGYPVTDPVFYDIEHATWTIDPAGAEAAAAQWKAAVAAAGWRKAYWYGPLASHCDWVANWTGVRPAALPPGRIGVQYDHALSSDRYDISVFDPALLGPGGTDDMTYSQWAQADRDALARDVAQAVIQRGVAPFNGSVSDILNDTRARLVQTQAELSAVHSELDAVKAAIGAAGPVVAGTFTITGSGAIGTP